MSFDNKGYTWTCDVCLETKDTKDNWRPDKWIYAGFRINGHDSDINVHACEKCWPHDWDRQQKQNLFRAWLKALGVL